MKKKNNTKIVLGIIFAASIAVIVGSLSYAYFSIDTSDNKNQEVVIQSGTMQLRFADNDTGFNGKLNFGESAEKLFILENTGTLPSKAKINFTNMINTYRKGSLTYKLEYKTTEEGTTWTEVLSKKNVPRSATATKEQLANNLEVPVGQTYYYRLTVTLENLDGVDQTQDINAIFSTEFNLEEASESPFEKVIANVNSGNPDFSKTSTTDEGIYALEDDYGTSYYYRGASQTNYIKYGKNKDGQDMYWRIIRINGDGSIRIIYDGTQAYANGTIDDTRYAKVEQVWNTQYNDAKYVGYMFGGSQGEASTSKELAQANETNSEAKTAVDTWYKENIVNTGYGSNVVDAIFCNDRSTPGKEATGWSSDTGLGYANNYTAYGATARTGVYKTDGISPNFTCEVKKDAFTVNESEKGNGNLSYPVGLITADEILAAGSGKWNIAGPSRDYYLYKSSYYIGWTLSSYNFSASARVFSLHTSGFLGDTDNQYSRGAIAPVINLSADYAENLIGDGTMTNPYRERGVEP